MIYTDNASCQQQPRNATVTVAAATGFLANEVVVGAFRNTNIDVFNVRIPIYPSAPTENDLFRSERFRESTTQIRLTGHCNLCRHYI